MTGLTYGTPQEVGMDPERIALLHERALEWIDPLRMRCAVLLAARRGKIVFHEAYGPLTWEEGSPSTEKDSIFRSASITKPFTATLAMMLVEDGLLGLNRPVTEYLPEVCGEGTRDVEVQHLLTHTSGFDEEVVEERFDYFKALERHTGETPDDGLHPLVEHYLTALWEMPITKSPGSQMSYSDHNYNLLGEIVRRVSGKSLKVLAKERLFGPLGLTDTSYERDPDTVDKCARRREGLKLPGGIWGADGLDTTALDLARFGQMFLDKGRGGNHRVLSPASVYEMTRNQIPGIGSEFKGFHDEASWGLGWAVQHNDRWRWVGGSLHPVGTFYHTGAGGNAVWVDPVNEIVGVYLSVCLDVDMSVPELHWNLDLFENMVTAAVVD